MPKLSILDTSESAQLLSERLQLPISGEEPSTDLVLAETPERLELRWTAADSPGPVAVDFVRWMDRLSSARRGLLSRAIGVPKGVRDIVDGTAGLGRDAFTLAGLGCQVRLIERSPVLVVLLEDGLRRAKEEGGKVAEIATRMQLIEADCGEWIRTVDSVPEAIYLDPMFPDRGKSARAKKEMQLFRDLLGHGSPDPNLLALCRARCKRRVVVKRQLSAPPLGGPADSCLKGKMLRYDLYAPRSGA